MAESAARSLGEQSSQRAPRHAPRHIALIDAGALAGSGSTDAGDAVSRGCATQHAAGRDTAPWDPANLLLRDFSRAYAVYDEATHTGRTLIERWRRPDSSGEQDEATNGAGGRDSTAFDALVLGLSLGAGQPTADVLARLEAAFPFPTTCREHEQAIPLFAIASTASHDPAAGEEFLVGLGTRCPAAGLRWGGGVAVAGGDLLAARMEGSPRMGFLRRPASEAVDQLIAVMRSGLTVAEAAGLPSFGLDQPRTRGCGVITARCPVPRIIYERMRKRTS